MTLKLSTLSVVLGLAVCVPQIYGLLNPKGFAAAAKKLPRNVPLGIVLMLVATAWFVFYVNQENDADFAAMKHFMIPAFIGIGIGCCLFVQDFLAARAIAVLMLLLARLMTDAARWPDTHWRWVISGWAYVLVVGGIWFTVSPWRMRDVLEWATATEGRVRAGCAVRLAFALFVVALGLTVF
jgi:hypothetical protein